MNDFKKEARIYLLDAVCDNNNSFDIDRDSKITDDAIEAMVGFAMKKWDEACEAQKKICAKQETPHKIIAGIETWEVFTEEEKKLILNSPKAEYK